VKSGALRRTGRFGALTMEAWIALAIFDIARPAGFARLCAWLHRRRPSRRRHAATEDIVWAVDEACVWYVKRAACLQRSVVATWMLRRHGIAAEMVIGCRSLPFESHAWVEVDGRVVNDLPQYQRAFTVLNRL
jgi:transglutaminase superfamily protein